MKQLSVLLLSGVVLALAGCGNQGSSSDPYNTDSGTTSTPNYNRLSVTNEYQGNVLNPDRRDAIDMSSTNYPGWVTNDQNSATNSRPIESRSQPIDPERTNNVPEN